MKTITKVIVTGIFALASMPVSADCYNNMDAFLHCDLTDGGLGFGDEGFKIIGDDKVLLVSAKSQMGANALIKDQRVKLIFRNKAGKAIKTFKSKGAYIKGSFFSIFEKSRDRKNVLTWLKRASGITIAMEHGGPAPLSANLNGSSHGLKSLGL